MRVKKLSGRRALVVAEFLEKRQLLAYYATDYFPLGVGNNWKYDGTLDGAAATIANLDSQLDIAPATRLNLLVGTAAAQYHSGATVFTHDSAGLKLHKFDANLDVDSTDADTEVDLTFASQLKILNPVINTTDAINLGSVATTARIRDNTPGGGFQTYTFSGTTSGTSNVQGIERVTLSDGRFIDAIKFQLNLTFNFSGSALGVTGTVTGTDNSTYCLGFGIGIVKRVATSSYTFAAPALGISQSDSASTSLTLKSSNLLPADSASLASGLLTLTGTTAGDLLSITNSGTKTIATRGGVSEEFNTSAVTGIVVSGQDGNDSITIGAGVRGVYVDAGTGNDIITGGSGPDTITGGAGKDRINGGGDNDRLNGNGGHDNLVGDLGDDRLYGNNENDTMEGGAGVDRCFGGIGDDLIGGNGSNDKLYGEDGNDILSGGTQDDLLDGGAGIDLCLGGTGSDSFVLQDSAIDTANGGGAELDTVLTKDNNDVLSNI